MVHSIVKKYYRTWEATKSWKERHDKKIAYYAQSLDSLSGMYACFAQLNKNWQKCSYLWTVPMWSARPLLHDCMCSHLSQGKCNLYDYRNYKHWKYFSTWKSPYTTHKKINSSWAISLRFIKVLNLLNPNPHTFHCRFPTTQTN